MIGITDEGELARALTNAIDDEFIFIDSPKKVYETKPEIVIHTLEDNSNNPSMWNLNTWFAINIAKAANKIGSLNVYFSTFMIYDGKRGYYSETSTPSPLNYYGMTKLVGETAIASLGNYLILRLGAVYSPSYRGFLFHIIKALIKKGIAKCNTNLYLSPISVKDVAYAVKYLLKKDARGVINLAGKRFSEYDICKKFSDDYGGLIIPIEGKYFDFSLDNWLLRSFGLKIDGI
jgi:dTDP-4-dehydrorhamnose reductase